MAWAAPLRRTSRASHERLAFVVEPGVPAVMRCCICRRPLLKAFAWTLYREAATGPALPSPVGPTCAERTRLVVRRKRVRVASTQKQMDLLEAAC